VVKNTLNILFLQGKIHVSYIKQQGFEINLVDKHTMRTLQTALTEWVPQQGALVQMNKKRKKEKKKNF